MSYEEEQQEKTVTKIIRRMELSAQSTYELGRLVFPREHFLESSFEEEREEVTFRYIVDGYTGFEALKNERRETVIINLLDCAGLAELAEEYQFSLNPDNLYYNVHNQVAVMERDIYRRGEAYQEEVFLQKYRALIGHMLQNKYSYADYENGGMDLLSKDKFLARIRQAERLEDMVQCLWKEYRRLMRDWKENKQVINRRTYRRHRIALWIESAALAAGVVFAAYTLLWNGPYQNAVIEAQHSYLRINYSGVIEALRDMDMDRMSVYDKYILANAYVQSENLTDEQRKNIVSALSLDTNEKVLDYWISLGRLDVSEAENIAQQISDNDLLLYAYLKEKDMTESDTTISGEEKSGKLESLNGKIEQLSGLYEEDESADTQTDEQADVQGETEQDEDLHILDDQAGE